MWHLVKMAFGLFAYWKEMDYSIVWIAAVRFDAWCWWVKYNYYATYNNTLHLDYRKRKSIGMDIRKPEEYINLLK